MLRRRHGRHRVGIPPPVARARRSLTRRGGPSWPLWLCLVPLLAACGGATPTGAPRATETTRVSPPPSGVAGATPPALGTAPFAGITTVFVIVLENRNWADIKANPAAPYLNGTLLPQASHAERYFNPPGVHPSLPNYLWLEAGQDFGIADDRPPSAHHQATTDHLVTQLDQAGIPWKSYQEGIDGATCPLTSAGRYDPKHNPLVYFDDVTGANDPRDAGCIAHVRPYAELAADLRADTIARYNFITPDLCHDMHDPCAPTNNGIKQGDDWLAAAVPPILAAPAYRRGGALFITWDEGAGGDGPIGLLALSPQAKGDGYQNTIRYTHSSLLATLQRIFGVGPPLGDAATANDLRDLFSAPATPATPRTARPDHRPGWARAP
jgi:hypothetical protein